MTRILIAALLLAGATAPRWAAAQITQPGVIVQGGSGGTATPATSTAVGGVKQGPNNIIDPDGTLHTAPDATAYAHAITRATLNQGVAVLAYGATITYDASQGALATVTLTGNPAFACPVNAAAGATLQEQISQDATGGRAPTWPACFKWPGGTAGVLSTAAGARDVLTLSSFDGSTFDAVLTKAFQ